MKDDWILLCYWSFLCYYCSFLQCIFILCKDKFVTLFIKTVSSFFYLLFFQLTNLRIILCFLPEAQSCLRKSSIKSMVGNLDVVFPLVKAAAKEV